MVPEKIREQIKQADRNRCAHCQTAETISGVPLTVDHIQPISKGGKMIFENLCLACRPCNEFKAANTEAMDPLTNETVLLFNPRLQVWSDHFRWNAEATRIEGLTPNGRATVIALRMNREVICATRARWVWGGWHPPTD